MNLTLLPSNLVKKGDTMTIEELIKKLDNIWYHYKIHIIYGLFILMAIIPLIFFNEGEKPSALNVAVIGNTIDIKEQQALQDKATSAVLEGQSKSEIKLNIWPMNGSLTSSSNNSIYQKLLTQIGAKDIDIVVLDKNDFLLMAQQDAFFRMDNNKEISNLLNNKEIDTVSLNRENSIIGIDFTDNLLLSNAGFITENKIIGILTNSENKETAIKFVKWLVNKG
ncbi:hypothetical protein LIT25_26965 (plasmid) [Bacillus sp. F19]|nr:hypothetical protein LIT25_26965 [Bacillus sp. F19]